MHFFTQHTALILFMFIYTHIGGSQFICVCMLVEAFQCELLSFDWHVFSSHSSYTTICETVYSRC